MEIMPNIGVSILVFLEWPLGPPGRRSHGRPHLQFQSLFFWNGLWDLKIAHQGVGYAVFQSLFFWNGLWDPMPVLRRGR